MVTEQDGVQNSANSEYPDKCVVVSCNTSRGWSRHILPLAPALGLNLKQWLCHSFSLFMAVSMMPKT